MKKRIIALIAAAVFVMGIAAACTPGIDDDKGKEVPNDMKIWFAPSTVRVLQDKQDYKALADNSRFEITAARGEYESVQLIITPQNKVLDYFAEAGSLALESDPAVRIDKSNIEIFAQKYVHIHKVNSANKSQPGWYPDALLPIGLAKEHGENIIESGQNQGLWLTVKVPHGQTPGKYAGRVTLTTDGVSSDITLNVIIKNATVPSKVSTKSIFLTNWQYQNGELDTSQDMFNAYTDALLDFRLSPHILVNDTNHTQAEVDYYANLAYEYAKDERFTNFSVPYKQIVQPDGEFAGELNIDSVVFDRYLTAIAKISFEKNFNVMGKLITYWGLIDEPYLQGIYDRVRLVQMTFEDTVASVADRLEADLSITAPNKAEVIQSLRNTKNVLTSPYHQDLADVIDYWCPTFDHYHSQEDRMNYDEQTERWWYGCVVPKYPYPTYHIDDNLISSRIVSWMQADYDVVGNLYWATNIYAKYSEKDGIYEPIEDYYGVPERYPNVNGDGFLFYPGKKYGIDGPLATLRLHSIRDGLEEYELIQQLQQQYKERTQIISGTVFSADKILSTLYNSLYSGTRVLTTEGIFAAARAQLLELAEFTNSGMDAYIVDVDFDADKTQYKILVQNAAEVYQDGVKVNDKIVAGEGLVFTLSKTPTASDTTMTVMVKVGEQEQSVILKLGGRVLTYLAETMADNITVTDGDFELVNASTVPGHGGSGQLAKLMLPQTESNRYQSVIVSDIFSDIGKDTDKMSVQIYNSSSADVKFSFRFKYSGETLEHEITNGTLKPGHNTIEIANIYGYSWESYISVDSIRINFGELSDDGIASSDKIYLGDITVTMV